MTGPAFDLGAYLGRVGLSPDALGASEGRPGLRQLALLQEAHCAAIPFENLDLHLGRPISLDLEALQAKLVAGRRGGYCYEQNTVFAAALEALGFQVTRLAARVRANSTEVRPRTHMLLRVEVPEGAFLADTGFGGEGPIVPVPLPEEGPGREVWTGPPLSVGHRVVREGAAGPRVLQVSYGNSWSDLYAFTFEPQIHVDYEMANHFTSTYPRSPFVLNLTAQRARRRRRAILRNRDLLIRDGSTATPSEIRDPEHLLEVLAAEFDLHFPAGTRFGRPEF